MPGNLYLDPSSGRVMQTPDADRAQQRGWQPVSQAEADAIVAKRKERETAESFGSQVRAGAEGLGTGLYDSLTAIPRAGLHAAGQVQEALVGAIDPSAAAQVAASNADLQANLTGRAAMSNFAGVTSELRGLENSEAAARRNAQGQRLRAEVNPGISAAGTFVGEIAPLVASGGLGGLGKATAQGLGGSLAARVGASALASGIEGAPLMAIQNQDQAFLEDRQLTGEMLNASYGFGGVLGMGFGAGGALLGAGAKALASSAGRAGSGALGAAGRALGIGAEAAELGTEKAAGKATGEAGALALGADVAGEKAAPALGRGKNFATAFKDGDIESVFENQTGMRAAPNLQKTWEASLHDSGPVARETLMADTTEGLTAHARKMVDAANEIPEVVDRATLKQGQVATKFAAEGIGEEAVAKSRDFLGGFRDEIERLELESGLDAATGKAVFKGFRNVVKDAEGKLGEDISADGAYMVTDQVRRDSLRVLQSFNQSLRNQSNPEVFAAMQKAIPEINKLYTAAREFTYDTDTWGTTGAAQKEINAARTQLIAATQDRLSSFADTLRSKDYDAATGTLSTRVEVNEAKMANLVRRFGTVEGAAAKRGFAQYAEAAENFSDAIAKHLELTPEQAATVKALKDSTTGARKMFDEAGQKVGAWNQVEMLKEMAAHGAGSGKLGAIVGGFVGGGPGAALGSVVSEAIGNPVGLMERRFAMAARARSIKEAVGTALDGYFAPMMPKLAEAGRKVGAAVGEVGRAAALTKVQHANPLAMFQGKHDTIQQAYAANVASLISADHNYSAGVRNWMTQNMGDVARTDPQVVQSMSAAYTRGIQFLLGKMPTPLLDMQSLTPHSSPVPVSKVQAMEFSYYWQTVNEPMSAIRSFTSGYLAPEQAEALKAVYPSMFKWVQRETMARIANMDAQGVEVPVRQRTTIDLLLDLNGAGDPTNSAEFMARFGPRLGDGAAQQEQQQKQAAPSMPKAQIRASERIGTGTNAMIGAGMGVNDKG